MNMQLQTQVKAASQPSFTPAHYRLLQRKCACGQHTVAGGECVECARKKHGLQRKLAIGASNDPLEREAERVAEQVMAAPTHPLVNGAPPRIQRYTGQAAPGMETAPASADRVLTSPGRPLDPALRQDMEQRFGHDFSRVRVHSGAAAEQSVRDVNAYAYTVGQNIVFGAGRFALETHEGRRLIAHELTHVVQQSSSVRTLETQSSLQRFAPFEFIGDLFSKGPGEAISRLFSEGSFSEKELSEYLNGLTQEGKPEGRYDSDNKARAVVSRWKTGDRAIQLTGQLKKLLIREMWEGTTSSVDAQGILDVLDRSLSEDLQVIFGVGGVYPKELYEAFGAPEKIRLRQFYDRRFKGGYDAAMKNIVDLSSSVSVAPNLNDTTFRAKWSTALAYAIAALKTLTAKGDCAFPHPDERRIDDANWKPMQSPKDRLMGTEAFVAKSDSPFEAVGLLFTNLDKWTCDCRLFPELAMLYAWREALSESPDAFNQKFANLQLRAEGTTGLERDIAQTDDDAAWKAAPVGTKVAWESTSPTAKVPWTYEHGIKTFQGKLGEEDRFAAQPLGYDLTEYQVKEKLAQNASDYPWVHWLAADSEQGLIADGADIPIVESLRSIYGIEVTGVKAFLDLQPLVSIRKQAKQDPPRFTHLINTILRYARHDPTQQSARKYVETYIHRLKLEIPK